ncbi:MAG: glycosyl hydrolase family 28-related protein, partial [Acutalibacteraceae bacterium]
MKKRGFYYICGMVIIAVLLSVLGMVFSNIAKKPVHELETNFFNVKDFGAVGDGKNDDADGINKALEQALKNNGTVFFPSGTYLITSTINIEKDDSRVLKFKGEEGTKIIGAESLQGDILKTDLKYNFYISDMEFEHKGSK